VPRSPQNSKSISPFTWLHFLDYFPESATKFNALQFSQEGSSV
jgi:hypothetical protein